MKSNLSVCRVMNAVKCHLKCVGRISINFTFYNHLNNHLHLNRKRDILSAYPSQYIHCRTYIHACMFENMHICDLLTLNRLQNIGFPTNYLELSNVCFDGRKYAII